MKVRLETLGFPCAFDAETREHQLRGSERFEFHQLHRGAVIEELHRRLEAQLSLKKMEGTPASGHVTAYLLRHWKGLNAFLRVLTAPSTTTFELPRAAIQT